MKKVLLVLVCILWVIPCAAETIIVDCNGTGDYTNIQNAINNSLDGDTIIVKPGTYNENLFYNGRAITITSDPSEPNAVQSTIITASSGYSVNFDWLEGPNSVLTGFTVTGRGIYCSGSSPTISENTITNCTGKGIYGETTSSPAISGNIISSNSGWGIDGCDGIITGNLISENSCGIAYCDGLISCNIIIQNGNDSGLYFCAADVVGNIIADNYASNGGGFYRCTVNASGNVIIGNKAGSDGGGLNNCIGKVYNNIIAGNEAGNYGGGLFNCGAKIYNNTIVGNMAYRGGAMDHCGADIRNNIIAFNYADVVGGAYESYNHSYNAFWINEGGNLTQGDPPGTGDMVCDPYFAIDGYWDSNGTPEEYDDFWVDGDYHLKSEAGRWDPDSETWVIDDVTSPCVDSGDPNSDWSGELWPHGEWINRGAYGGTTQASMSLSGKNNVANLTYEPEPNDWVDYNDLMLFTDEWLRRVNDVPLVECLDGCGIYRTMLEYLVHIPLAADLDRDGAVDFGDYAVFAMNWDPKPLPPEPNVMTWQTEPYAISRYAIAMLATTATTTDGSGVEYYFENTTVSGHDSGWQSEPNYTDTDLSAGTEYGYKVKARNAGNLKETEWSQECFATTFAQPPPEPNVMTWQTEPYAISRYAIAMLATTATTTDGSGVEYYFKNTTVSGHDSGWQSEPNYTDTDLSAGTEYGYKVKARNTGNLKETGWSQERFATTFPPDTTPPQPDPAEWLEQPYRTSSTSIRMVAEDADDPSGVEYYFECTSHPTQYSSGWQESPIYELTGLPEDIYSFVVRARDLSPAHNTTGDSNEVTVDLTPPEPNPMQWDPNIGSDDHDGKPYLVKRGQYYWAVMRAIQATDENGVEYKFVCVDNGDFTSGGPADQAYGDGVEWRNEDNVPGDPLAYEVPIAMHVFVYRWVVIARDRSPSHNTTDPSSPPWPALED